MKKFTEDNFKEIINKQFEINGYDIKYEDAQQIDEWYLKYSTNIEKENEFREWLKQYIKPFTIKQRLDKEINKFILAYGLTNPEAIEALKKEDN